MELLFLLSSLILFAPSTLADGLYGKNSAVLQIDGTNYAKLIEKSNYSSIVEFYAPWCGHCKNLKPEYEKAAKALAGHARVAAVNCDDELNKPFCGSQGIQGFPTLKIVRPKKKGGKPTVTDYRGERSADAIIEAMEDKIPNHVTKLTDSTLDDWLAKGDKPKAVFFSEKAALSPLIKGIAIDFLGAMDVGQVKSTEKGAMERFGVDSVPKVYFMGSGQHVPEQHQGKLTKTALVEFFTGTGLVAPNPDYHASNAKAAKAAKPKADKKDKKKEPGPGKPTRVQKPTAASETIEDQGPPTESPDPKVDTEQPIQIPLSNADNPIMQIIQTEDELRQSCLTTISTTCVIAVMSESGTMEENAMKGIKFIHEVDEIVAKYKGRKIFPFYGVPVTNPAGAALLGELGVKTTDELATVVAVNAKRGWWTPYEGELTKAAMENWVDGIKFGDFKKHKLAVKLDEKAPAAKVEEPIISEELLGEDLQEKIKQAREKARKLEERFKPAEEQAPKEDVDADHDEL